jgi:hypothetical protein
LNLALRIQESFTKPEIERYFRVSTTLGGTRVFSNSMDDFLQQEDLPDQVNDLSFWIEGWDQKTRFDKNILLDFGRYSAQLHVEGTDPVWVFDKFNSIMKFLKNKTPWYWPIITWEKLIVFSITVILISSLFIAFIFRDRIYFTGKIALLGVWTFLTFYDLRKIWPYSSLRLRGAAPALSKENINMVAAIIIVLVIIWQAL